MKAVQIESPGRDYRLVTATQPRPQPGVGQVLIAVIWVELLAMAVFGLSMVFIGRKVEYIGKPSAPAEHSHH